MAQQSNNISLFDRIDNELNMVGSSVSWMVIAILSAHIWTIYLSFYNSRILGLVITAAINKFLKYGHVKFGSFSFSVLSGKLMFRDVHFITEDYSVRAQYGWIIFRWWRPYVYRELTEDLSHLETRMSVFLDGFEFHAYNRSEVYGRLEKLFRGNNDSDMTESAPEIKETRKFCSLQDLHWRDLIPVTKIEIISGRMVFGNYLMPYSFLLKCDRANVVYTTKPASTVFDKFMHILKCDIENARLMLVSSPKYNGPVQDEPPRFMGEGFVVMMSNNVDVYYYQDEPGVVQHEPEQIQMADGEVQVRRTFPCIGIDIKCGKNTDFNYGPWVDRQRELIWKFFYPPDYQPLVPTREAEPGEKRQFKTMEVKLTINAVSTIDILFTKNAVTQALHMNAGKGSYVEVTVPYIVEETGFVTKIKGQLMLVDATTSMSFRSLLECETLEFDVTASYPREWNACQEWRCDLTACKTVANLIYDLKTFFSDLVNDWSSKSVPDIYTFVPYTWTLSLVIKQFEILTLSNDSNWVDTSSQHQENAHIAFCGDNLDLCVTFPFNDFLPETVSINLVIKGETVFCRLHLPESNTMSHTLLAMSQNIRIVDREGNDTGRGLGSNGEKQWRNVTLKNNGWVDCWTTPYVFFTLTYVYYPAPVLLSQSSPDRQAHYSMCIPILEEEFLDGDYLQPSCSSAAQPGVGMFSSSGEPTFDPGLMKPDSIHVELEVAPSILILYGSLLRNLLHLKENYLGEFQKATDFVENPSKQNETETSYVRAENPEDDEQPFDPRRFRPFSVTVSVTLHDIQAHLAKNCAVGGPPCPTAHVERLCFEMDKSFRETKLQLLLSPCLLLVKDNLVRDSEQEHLREGHLALSGLQVRGHAMFSLEGLPLDSETLEYAWLLEVIIGDLTGKLTTPQLQNIVEFLQTFIMMIENAENKLQTSLPFKQCQHLLPQISCFDSKNLPFPCPSSEEVKYEMTRISVDFVSIFLVESGAALNLQIHPVRIANCNLHGPSTRAGVTGTVDRVDLKQFVSNSSAKQTQHNWLEAGGLSLGPIMLEAAMALPHSQLFQNQDRFLRLHDAKTRRLWFLWSEADLLNATPTPVVGKCGCLGGCSFFGKNKNGLTFFKIKRHRDGNSVVAIPQICKDGSDPGFGQSLLHAGKLVFETSQLTLRLSPTKLPPGDIAGFSFTRGYMSELASPETDEAANKLDTSLVTPTEDVRPKSTFSDTQMLIAGTKQGEVRRFSKESLLTRQSSLPSADKGVSQSHTQFSVGLVAHSGSKKGKSSFPVHMGQSSPPIGPKDAKSVKSGSECSDSMTSQYHTLHTSSKTPPALRRPISKISMESGPYFTADEEDSSDEGNATLTNNVKDITSLSGKAEDKSNKQPQQKKRLVKKKKKKNQQPGSTDFVSATSSVSSLESSLSFCSAPSDNDSDLSDGEDQDELIDMINLHSHMNQPITESPLLLSCYSQHLSHYYCQDWCSSGPQMAVYTPRSHGLNSVQSEYSLSSAGHSIYSAGTAWTPHFLKVKDGFSVNIMKSRSDVKKGSPTTDLNSVKATLDREHRMQTHPEEKLNSDNPPENVSKTTAVISLTGSLDMLVTPLLLEAFQRYIEAVTPTLSKLHPASLIDTLHSQCLDRLKQQNKLKKGKGLNDSKTEDTVENLASSKEVMPVKTSSLQVHFTLPKINVCVLQASIVEEVIAFSSLGTASDLTAVSLLAVCIDSIRCQLLSNKHSCQVAVENTSKEPLTRKTSATPVSGKNSSSQARGKGEVNPLEPDVEKPQEITREENVGTLHISHIHVQLRRLLKFSNFSEHVLLTAIPEPYSRVMFTLEQDSSTPVSAHPGDISGQIPGDGNAAVGGLGISPSPKRRLSRTSSRERDMEGTLKGMENGISPLASSIGFIMCESGLEDISVTAVRRLGYHEVGETQAMEEKLSGLRKKVTMMQEAAKATMEKAATYKTGEKSDGKQREDENVDKKKEESPESSTEDPDPLSSPSGHVDSASLSSSTTWGSNRSLASSETSYPSSTPAPEPLSGDASNGRLNIKTIWLNFASPPPISIHKKVDFTRLDWNLLSTATPAIDAWLNPSDRLMTSVRTLVREYSKHLCCVMACMMIEGLECQGIHIAYKSKFNKLTPLAKTLQEDPSNQLLTVLRKYLLKYGTDTVDKAVASESIPQLITVQKGILALMRQWKNVLYMPNLNEINFKTQRNIRPYNVSFTLPKDDPVDEVLEDNDDVIIDQFDIVDEKMSLLQAEGGMTQRSSSVPSLNSKGRHSISTQGKTDKTDGLDFVSAESFSCGKPVRLSNIFKGKKSAVATDSPLDHSSSNLAPPPLAVILNRNDSNMSFTSLVESMSSNEQLVMATPPHTPLRAAGPKHSILKNRYKENEDLYQWMAKQQSQFPMDLDDDPTRYIHQNTAESCAAGLGSAWSQDDSKLDVNEGDYTMATSIMQLADAQYFFKPFLQSLGLHVESVRPSAMMKKFGGHLLLQGHVTFFKILIAQSEAMPSPQATFTTKGKGRGKRSVFRTLPENAAFQIESYAMNVSLKDVVDFGEGGESTKAPYKFAMHKLEAKPSTLQINLLVNCQAIRQNVDMALLRLAHQVLTMVGNVKNTRVELKQKRTESSTWLQTHRKQESKDSTSSVETNQSDTSHTDRLMGSFPNIMNLEKQRKKDMATDQRPTSLLGRTSKEPAPSTLNSSLGTKTDSKLMTSLKTQQTSALLGPKASLSSTTSPPSQHLPTPVPGSRAEDSSSSRGLGSVTTSESKSSQVPTNSSKSSSQERKRPQGLPIGVIYNKKSGQLRFSHDSKEGSSSKKVGTPGHQHSSSEVMTPPHSLNLSDSVVLDMADTSSPAVNEKTIVDEIKASTPQCWRHLYQLLELYATMPEPKTVVVRHSQAVSKLPVIEEEETDHETSVKRESRVHDYSSRLSSIIKDRKHSMLHGLRRDSGEEHEAQVKWSNKRETPVQEPKRTDKKNKVDEMAKEEETLGHDSSLARQSLIRTKFKQSIYVGESVPLIVYGILKVEKFIISAELSGLKLEAFTSKVHTSGTYKKRVKGFHHRVSSDSSFTAHVGHSMIHLREGIPPDLQTVVTVNISKSQGLLTSVMRRNKEHNSVLVSVGTIDIDIPQHPVILHDMMSRSSKKITATLQELRWPAQNASRPHGPTDENLNQSSTTPNTGIPSKVATEQPVVKVIRKHLHIKLMMHGLVIGASILPSLKAQYKTEAITMSGVLGRKAHFTILLPTHLLSFRSKITAAAALADTVIPSAASIELPLIQVIADYRVQKPGAVSVDHQEVELGEDLQLLEGNYLYAVAEVGMLEHSLTTDLLNHLVFVQKVFMKEINEVVQKVSGGSGGDEIRFNKVDHKSSRSNPLLYSVSVRLKGIQVTATTPTSNAVRFETGAITLDLSNRFHLPKRDGLGFNEAAEELNKYISSQKMFIQAVVDLNLALGQLIKNPVFEEAEPEFHTMAFFKTTIKIRNALQHEMIPNLSHDQEALLINLSRPIILAQPLAFDKAVLVWLNYKNAYEYWTEQRMALNKEVLTATRQVIDKLPQIAPGSTPSIATLFLQLTVDDMGICVPLLSSYQPVPTNPGPGVQSPRMTEAEQGSALVLTVESTQISACSSGSLVSKGKFKNFCLRFADDFGSSWDDWKPRTTDSGSVMNQCNVPSGTYEVCSRTIKKQDTSSGNAKWILNVQWDMKGIDVHLDTDIGKRFTLLGHTLTLLAGDSDESLIDSTNPAKHNDENNGDFDEYDDDAVDLSSPATLDNSQEDLQLKRRTSLASDILPEEIFADHFDPKERARKIEREMNEQAKIVQELKECGAKETTIEIERKKLEDLQTLLFQDFRRDLMDMLKRKGDRASLIKDKLGLSSRPLMHMRSLSTGTHKMLSRSQRTRKTAMSIGHDDTRWRQSDDLSRAPRVSFSGSQLSTYTPPGTPIKYGYSESLSEDDEEDNETVLCSRQKSRSLEAIPSSGSDSQNDDAIPYARRIKENKRSEDSGSISSREQSNKLTEQNVDFELDVKVFIDRGKCVLYPKEAKEEEVRKNAKKEKFGSTDSTTATSPPVKKKPIKELSGVNISGQRKLSSNPDTTIFFVPSLSVKVHYNSRTDHTSLVSPNSTILEEPEMVAASQDALHSVAPEIMITSPSAPQREDSAMGLDSGSPRRSGQLKRASLYAWLTLQTLPEEMIISPSLLDFLEQALEPLSVTSSSSPSILKKDVMDSLVNNMELDASQVSLGQQSMAFFPVDVVVHIKVDPSFIRFNCHPISRVECLLQVPSLDLFFSTKKTDFSDSMLADSTQTPKTSKHAGMKQPSPSLSGSQPSIRSRHTSGVSDSSLFPNSNSGGLSVTGCLSDFSLYIFHPYGTGVQRWMAGPADSPAFRSNSGLERISENSTNAIHDLGRRDALSLNVEFIHVNISRTRKLERFTEPTELAAGSDQQTRSNVVRFSAICDIGTASFKYDMRRLSEILSLPKAWYRRTLARRLFLGDESINTHRGEEAASPSFMTDLKSQIPHFLSQNSLSHPSLNMVSSPTNLKKHHRRGSSGDKVRVQLSPEFTSEIASKRGTSNLHHTAGETSIKESNIYRKKSRTLSSPDMPRHRHSIGGIPPATAVGSASVTTSVSSSWETLVLFAVNLTQLNLEVNMANVMGNTEWCTKAVKTEGRLSINSSGHKNLNIEAGFGKSSFESKGGIVGGTIDVNNLHGFFSVCEDPQMGQDPDHQAGLSTSGLETKIDYMGSSIIMTRVSQLRLSLKDEWHVESDAQTDTPLATNRSAFLFVNGKLSWSHFHLMISRSTTPDLLKIISKLDEFFSQQVMSSRRVFQHTSAYPQSAQAKAPRKISESAVMEELRHHRHWQGALEHLVGHQFSMLPSMLPQQGMVLGGTMVLEGQGLMLASFHGINFRTKYWALFNIKDPYIFFSTEAQNIPEGVHIVQDLQFIVGQQRKEGTGVASPLAIQNHMATICKISRTQHMPPNFTTVDEWFTYALTSSASDPKVVTEFFGEKAGEEVGHKYSKVKATYYTHETEVIFAFPPMYMNLKTSHMQGQQPPAEDGRRPIVECSFVAEFYDHIYVAMDAEVILFLHDLVSSYIREKDRGSGAGGRMAASKVGKMDSKLSDPTTALKHDYRSFQCKTWQLEPTLRLIHWASTQIDPVGADYVLQKLGFSHARVTIPKWVQRGFMDPLDKVLSVLVDKLITTLRDQQANTTTEEPAETDSNEKS